MHACVYASATSPGQDTHGFSGGKLTGEAAAHRDAPHATNHHVHGHLAHLFAAICLLDGFETFLRQSARVR